MTKTELIARIRKVNRSARPKFLGCFTERELRDYLKQLESIEAATILKEGGQLPKLAQAVGELMIRSVSDPTATLDLVESLKYGGFVAEQGALALYRRLGIRIPRDRNKLELRTKVWRNKVSAWLHCVEARISERLASR